MTTGLAKRRSAVPWALLAGLAIALVSAPMTPSAAWADDPDRPLPDYDGREDPPPDAGDMLLWVPRVVFYPVYLVTEYLIRAPVGAFISWLEREHVIEHVSEFFTFGPDGASGFFPTFFWEFNFRPSVGFYFFSDGVFDDADAFRVHFAWGGDDWWRFTIRERVPIGQEPDPDREPWRRRVGASDRAEDRHEMRMAFILDYRPDHLFFGIGPRSSAAVDTRFSWNRYGGELFFDLIAGLYDGVSIGVESTRNELGPGSLGEDASATDAFPDAPGWNQVYTLTTGSVDLFADTRAPRPEPGTGMRVEAFGAASVDFTDTDLSFLRYGGALSFFLDLTGRQRVLSLRQDLALLKPLGSAAIPVPEFLTNDGTVLRGLQPGRFRGESLWATHLQWSYPIWFLLDGFIFADTGNVFGEDFAGFDLDDFVMTFGGGFRSNGDRDLGFEVRIGAGTTRFGDNDFGIDQIYFGFGSVGGF